MKRFVLPFALCIVWATQVQAQFFLELHGNYLMPLGGLTASSSSVNNSGTSSSGTVQSERINFGQGTGGGMVLGSGISEVLGWEARFTYVSGKVFSYKNTYSSNSLSSTSEHTWRTNYLRIEPALRLHTAGSTVQGYVAVGPSIAVMPKSTHTYDGRSGSVPGPFNPGSTSTTKLDEEYTGGMGIGGFGAIGFTWKSQGAFGLFAELQATAMNWAPKEASGTVVETYSSEFGFPTTTTETNTVQFVDSYNANEENKELKQFLPMSTWGIRAGVRFTFGG